MPDNRDLTEYKLYAWKGQTRRQLRTRGDMARRYGSHWEPVEWHEPLDLESE